MNTEKLDELLDKYWNDGISRGLDDLMSPPQYSQEEQLRAAIHAEVARLVADERERWVARLTEKWHYQTGRNGETLAQYLGMSDEEYAKFVERGVDNTTTTNVAGHQEAS